MEAGSSKMANQSSMLRRLVLAAVLGGVMAAGRPAPAGPAGGQSVAGADSGVSTTAGGGAGSLSPPDTAGSGAGDSALPLGSAPAEPGGPGLTAVPPGLEAALRPWPFGVGESLKFSIQYGPIKAGTAVLAVEGVERVGERDCYRLASTAQSHAIFSAFYKVRDRVVSFVDVQKLLTRRTTKSLNEKDYHVEQAIDWDQEMGRLAYEDGSTIEFMPGARDVLGALYYVRTLPLEVGASIPVPAHDNKKSYPLVINVLAAERIDTPVGRFDCLVVEPKLLSDGLFRRSGSLKVWVTNDEERLPVMMQSAVKVGAISAILVELKRGDRAAPPLGFHVN